MLLGTHVYATFVQNGPPTAPEAAHGTHRKKSIAIWLIAFRATCVIPVATQPLRWRAAGLWRITKKTQKKQIVRVFFAPLKKSGFDSQKQGFRVKGLRKIEKVQFPRLCF